LSVRGPAAGLWDATFRGERKRRKRKKKQQKTFIKTATRREDDENRMAPRDGPSGKNESGEAGHDGEASVVSREEFLAMHEAQFKALGLTASLKAKVAEVVLRAAQLRLEGRPESEVEGLFDQLWREDLVFSGRQTRTTRPMRKFEKVFIFPNFFVTNSDAHLRQSIDLSDKRAEGVSSLLSETLGLLVHAHAEGKEVENYDRVDLDVISNAHGFETTTDLLAREFWYHCTTFNAVNFLPPVSQHQTVIPLDLSASITTARTWFCLSRFSPLFGLVHSDQTSTFRLETFIDSLTNTSFSLFWPIEDVPAVCLDLSLS